MEKPVSKKKALDCLNKLGNYAMLKPDHRWVSVIRHFILEKTKELSKPEPTIPQRDCNVCETAGSEACVKFCPQYPEYKAALERSK